MKRLLIALLVVFAYISTSGCAKDAAEDAFAADLRGSWLKFPDMSATEALETNQRLLTEALALESTGDLNKLSPDGVIGNLALRQYVLCQIMGRSAEAEYNRNLAFRRLVRAKIIPEAYTEAQKEELFEKIAGDLRTVEAASWRRPQPQHVHESSSPR